MADLPPRRSDQKHGPEYCPNLTQILNNIWTTYEQTLANPCSNNVRSSSNLVQNLNIGCDFLCKV